MSAPSSTPATVRDSRNQEQYHFQGRSRDVLVLSRRDDHFSGRILGSPLGEARWAATAARDLLFVAVSDLECLTLERLQCLDSLRDLRRTAAPALMESASFTGIEGPQLQSSRCAVLGTGGRCLLRA
jgi:hypothetical protein